MSPAPPRLIDVTERSLLSALRGEGVCIDYGACRVRVRARDPAFVRILRDVYRHFPFIEHTAFADLHVRLARGRGLRRWLRPTVRFALDGVEPFEPFPASDALPLYEWGVNWCFGQRFNQHVLLHAAVLEYRGRGIVMAAIPGSGKSTLAAAMMLRGFRLLSDEFGVLAPASGLFLPMVKPVALKNRAIDVIRGFSAEALIGPVFAGTRKGAVAHLAPDAASVAACAQAVRPALVVFPAYRRGAALQLTPQSPEQAFARLAFNSFNYALLGPLAFHAVADVAQACPAYELRYGALDEAVACLQERLDAQRGLC
ncbi:MAG TPA: HprK-related kinase A [Rhodocyclaceae bacterium]|nr:HprK-related kinase A [Rhodocyclaceae bacterium]